MPEIKQVSMRLPVDLHEQLVAAADTDRRSLHAEILEILEAYFDIHRLRYRVAELERTVTKAGDE